MKHSPDEPAHDVSEVPAYPHVFEPIRIGAMSLRNRVMLPPHASAIGNLWGSQADANRNIAYWESRAKAGVAWIDGVAGRVRNRLVPGFEPHGYGAETTGFYRLPFFVERVQQMVAAIHAAGATVTSQLTVIGGNPHTPSRQLSAPLYNSRPHVLRRDEIAWYVEEYRFSARQARRAGLDGIELHLNHDDLLEWFLSPLTNHREDEFGGSLENRARFAVQVLTAVREEIGTDMTLGVRFNLREEMPGAMTPPRGSPSRSTSKAPASSTSCTLSSARPGGIRATSNRSTTPRRSGPIWPVI
ncbi:oxidoreductase [Haloactinomyces albus]|uniref:2,4-dienoyl-CoA reductase-like NADH-dependent reductase (Old Yellow Enzyme family) n=1 Tax=Haloactinomyces albus TaxID=1352928 RepID=A0AAE4CMZ1_9ACTN|nr:hypothetical protein [Haloactinomyces albus]MDR7303940.1 2,4-dienoyl-CoA reductase-like NADH-dependent reductase (Old Yellow Enzyme family) [Haloactinomyces albus]